jgi:isopenicillin-N N-acyltransferase-like protein
METRYREVDVSGEPFEMGRQIGEATRDEIRGFSEVVIERVNKTFPVSREKALEVARASVPFAEQYSKDMVDELKGMSEGSGVSFEELMLLQVRNQLQPEGDAGCTSFAISSPASQGTVVGQNWDNDPGLDPFTVVLKRRPEGKPAFLSITQAGLISYIGLNDSGMGVCLNTLPAPSRGLGVPHYFTVRGIFETDSLTDAVQAVRRAHRAIPANIILVTPQGPADLEVTIEHVHVIEDSGSGVVTHTNHCEHPDLVRVNEAFPELIQSGTRKIRVERILGELSRPMAIEGLKDALRDHEGYPTSICRHPNDHPTTGYWATTFSVIIEPEAGLLHASRGTPCSQPYETYALN